MKFTANLESNLFDLKDTLLKFSELDLKQRRVRDNELGHIINVLKNSTILEKLDFTYVKCSKSGFKAIFEALANNKTIKLVNIFTVKDWTEDQYSKFFKENELLTTISLNDAVKEIRINSLAARIDIFIPLAKALGKNTFFTYLTYYNVNYNTAMITNAIIKNTTLTTLAYPPFTDSDSEDDKSLDRLIQNTKSLKHLYINNNITRSQLSDLKINTSIKSLIVSQFNSFYSKDLIAALATNQSIRTLFVYSNGKQSSDLSPILSNNRLRRIEIPVNDDDVYSTVKLFFGLVNNNGLQYLKISPKELYPPHKKDILRLLAFNNTLEELDLPANSFNEEDSATIENTLSKNRNHSIYTSIDIDKEKTHQNFLLDYRNTNELYYENLRENMLCLLSQFPNLDTMGYIDTTDCSIGTELYRLYTGLYNILKIEDANETTAWECLSHPFTHPLLKECATIALAHLVFSTSRFDNASSQDRIVASQFILAHLPARQINQHSFNCMAASEISTLLNNGIKNSNGDILSDVNDTIIVSWYQLIGLFNELAVPEKPLIEDILTMQHYHPAIINFLWQLPSFLNNLKKAYPSATSILVLEDFLSSSPVHWVKRTIGDVKLLKSYSHRDCLTYLTSLPNITTDIALLVSKVDSFIVPGELSEPTLQTSQPVIDNEHAQRIKLLSDNFQFIINQAIATCIHEKAKDEEIAFLKKYIDYSFSCINNPDIFNHSPVLKRTLLQHYPGALENSCFSQQEARKKAPESQSVTVSPQIVDVELAAPLALKPVEPKPKEITSIDFYLKNARFINKERRKFAERLQQTLKGCNTTQEIIDKIMDAKVSLAQKDIDSNLNSFWRKIKPLHYHGHSRLQQILDEAINNLKYTETHIELDGLFSELNRTLVAGSQPVTANNFFNQKSSLQYQDECNGKVLSESITSLTKIVI